MAGDAYVLFESGHGSDDLLERVTYGDPEKAGQASWRRWRKGQSGQEFIAALDVSLMDVSRFTMGLRPSPNGKVLVFADDERVIGLPAFDQLKEQRAFDAALLGRTTDLKLPVLDAGMKRWKERGGGDEICAKHLHDAPVSPSRRAGSELPADLEALVLACLEKDPAMRPRSAEALADRLRDCADYRGWSVQDARAWWRANQYELPLGEDRGEHTPLSNTALLVDMDERLDVLRRTISQTVR